MSGSILSNAISQLCLHIRITLGILNNPYAQNTIKTKCLGEGSAGYQYFLKLSRQFNCETIDWKHGENRNGSDLIGI